MVVFRGSRIVGLLLAAVVLFGCAESPEPPMRIGTNLWVGYEPLYLARALDRFPEEEVRLVELPATTDVIHALRAGTLEGAALTLDEVLMLLEEGMDLQIVLVLDFSHGGDAVVARPGLRRLEQLAGHRVGFEQTAVGAVMLNAALEAGGLEADQLELAPLTPDEHVKALSEGRVDAVVTYEPALSRLVDRGAQVLFDSRSLDGLIVDVLAVRPEVIERRPAQIRRLADGWFAALAHLESAREASLRIMARRQHIEPSQLARALAGIRLAGRDDNLRQLLGAQPALAVSARRLARAMARSQLLDAVPDTRGLLNPGGLTR